MASSAGLQDLTPLSMFPELAIRGDCSSRKGSAGRQNTKNKDQTPSSFEVYDS
jgi:hypothetical protein